ncbi:lycopene cyclase family protein [Glaciecola petra]|uniref:Lycopene cyclase family protein n=1 Tax=Glaciecola petra TaxID=3075602 RepID=A0ABU2ZQ70_9ALTE|nr:lycopene cyclase family protein [Aestuariibacter sp. P117]MDT0594745.1 lycopene cyclase family protein [Aestuariibacter sp. P117]
MSTHYDLIIIGAGAAGLSFLLALNERAYRGRVLILEAKSGFNTNKTWSFWQQEDMPDYLSKIIKRQWLIWRFSYQDQSIEHECQSQAYSCIDAKDFFELAEYVVSCNDNFNLEFNQTIDNLTQEETCASLYTSGIKFTGNAVIDTRISPMQTPKNAMYQCFYGIEVTTKEACFNDKKALVMENLKHDDIGIEFLYVLPFSETHALVEYTCFDTSPASECLLQQRIQTALNALTDGKGYTLVRSENGVLPMFNIDDSSSPSTSIIVKGGIAGGAMRASTGYCFLPIQRWASALADEYCATKKLRKIAPITQLYRWLDDVFLTVISRNKEKGPEIFFKFAKGMGAASFARFMSEKASTKDLLRAIIIMPKWLFLKGLIVYLFSYYKRRK